MQASCKRNSYHPRSGCVDVSRSETRSSDAVGCGSLTRSLPVWEVGCGGGWGTSNRAGETPFACERGSLREGLGCRGRHLRNEVRLKHCCVFPAKRFLKRNLCFGSRMCCKQHCFPSPHSLWDYPQARGIVQNGGRARVLTYH